jgi:S1-C subfamily serine protease
MLDKKLLYFLLVILFVAGEALADNRYLPSVAQVRVTSYSYSIGHPWQKGSGGKSFGSAVFIDSGRLLTNAHVIDSALRVELRRAGSDTWYRASIEHVSEASDLAMLKVADSEFYVGSQPAGLSSEINFGAEVVVVGFPEGGDTVSITKGVLSRTEETHYAYSGTKQLAYQIDAAINSGNSGGAVFSKGELVGISFQTLKDAENLGYAIPVSVIEQFVADAADGVIDGVPQLPFIYRAMTNANMHAYLGLSEKSGAYISETVGDSNTSCAKKGDAIIAINEKQVSAHGNVELPEVGAVSIDYIASTQQVGDSVELVLVRDGKELSVQCNLKYNWSNLWGAAGINYQYLPKWMEVGGLILVDMSEEVFMRSEEYKIEFDKVAAAYRNGLQKGTLDQPEHAIFVSNVLDHDANQGYDVTYSLLKSVNGEKAGNIESINEIIADNPSPWLILEFYGGDLAVFKQSELEQITQDLSAEYGI